MRFEWDPDKNLSNQDKHSISFEEACRVFLDPLHRSVQDRFVDGEQRWQTIGTVEGLALVLVAHTVRDDNDTEVIRIISARVATSKERRHYEKKS